MKRINKTTYNLSSAESIYDFAKQIEGMTFQDVLDLGILPVEVNYSDHYSVPIIFDVYENKNSNLTRDYENKSYKGGLGTLVEERFFGYKANNDREPDFPLAGLEVKTTCFNRLQNGNPSAGERLVLTMIPFNEPIEDTLLKSHLWYKCKRILIIYYEREKLLNGYDQHIHHAYVYTPQGEDLKIIEEDYAKIASIIQAGMAETLSEGMTNYLGACTKGATAESSISPQYYSPHTPAKKRAFCYKRSFMDYILHTEIIGDRPKAQAIVKDSKELNNRTFDEYVLNLLDPYVGLTCRQLCTKLGLEYKNSKALWHEITYAILGVREDNAAEFEKGNISVRTVRLEKNGKNKESMSLDVIVAKEIVQQDWEDSKLYKLFETTRFYFTVFKAKEDDYVLSHSLFWSMPVEDIQGPLRECWQNTKEIFLEGVELTVSIGTNCGCYIKNNLPKMSDVGSIAHVRPHAQRAAYKLKNGYEVGNLERDGDELPDGQIMTKQSFWLNSNYIYKIVSLDDDSENEN